ncbi:relaxase/mobilization nuclease RlxS [Sphingomonas sp. SRS2]|uniref:relaxase/mobilization nuclease RlxS n=1 Tax=Sphingomonas sp. SRS2 TaxID=133190 RepID=UPI00061847D0|nr:relaxase/mobilization nuclease RlxS [Sphingomonas sp. SRS2]KKC23867.1 conjugal transfer protein TraI [Sphingomonas sp. SRS2]
MGDDDSFEPRLGRIRSTGGSRSKRYLGRVLAASVLAGGNGRRRSTRFDGSRIGRGASRARVAASGPRARRVVVKARLVRLGTKGVAAARAHLRYIQRDGVTREGEPGRLYDAIGDEADGKAFLDRGSEDRHQFRFILSAEDGAEYPDLKPFVRRLMTQMEEDLGTRLDWVAVDHFNTGNPHSHIMLHGVDDRGQNLIIARDYIAHGMRARAEQLVTLDLGPRTAREIEAGRRTEISAERLTSIDRSLMRDADDEGIVAATGRDPLDQALRAGRLQKLADLGLAEEMGAGRWRLASTIEGDLRAISERGDIIRTLQRELSARIAGGEVIEHDVFKPDGRPPPLVGRVVRRGLADELGDRHFLLVDGVDGQTHYVAIGKGELVEPTPEGHIVWITARTAGLREVDRTVIEIAAANDGSYSAELHRAHDPTARADLIDAHVRRLEAIRRSTPHFEREGNGTWQLGNDHEGRVLRHEQRQLRDRPVEVAILADRPLSDLTGHEGASWLDRDLAGADPIVARDAGFGREVRAALATRRQWLEDRGFAEEEAGGWRYRPAAIAELIRRDLRAAALGLQKETGLDYRDAVVGDRIEGTVGRRVDLVSGRFAVLERAHEFTLVPWRPVFEQKFGKSASGIMRGVDTHWTFGRGRGGPQIE